MLFNFHDRRMSFFKKRKFYLSVLTLIFLLYFITYDYEMSSAVNSNISDLNLAKRCLKKSFQQIPEEKFNTTWYMLDENVNNCTDYFKRVIPPAEFPNNDEIKYGFLPNPGEEDICNVVTLGIGKDVRSEQGLLTRNTKCQFFGVDLDEDESGELYKKVLNGTFVKGLVGAKTGIYKADVLVKGSNDVYISETLMHYSFQDLLAKHYQHNNVIDYLFIDIEGDEFALMKDLINNPEKYPTICQINVEYHSPYENNRGLDFFIDFYKSIQYGPYFPINVNAFKSAFFNRMFLFNLNTKCVNKYL